MVTWLHYAIRMGAKDKTVEGAVGFFGASLLSILVVGVPLGLIASFLCTLVETLPLEIDDNLSVPLVCVLIFRIF